MHDVVMEIREEMKPLAKLDGMSRKPLSGMRNHKANSIIDYTEILDMTKEIKETLVEFQARVIQALRKLQHGSSPLNTS